MDKFVMLYHHYCPVLDKNIVIEQTIVDGEKLSNVCLNSSQCHCVGSCKNQLIDLEIKLLPV